MSSINKKDNNTEGIKFLFIQNFIVASEKLD